MNISSTFAYGKKWWNTDNRRSGIKIAENGALNVNGSFYVCSGSYMSIEIGAVLTLGSGYINHDLRLACHREIVIGNDVAISENVTIRDTDNHTCCYEGYVKTAPIAIGNHVWIGMNVTILKGVTIGDGAIIGAGAVVTNDIPPNCIAVGVPAKVVKTNIYWEP